MTAQASDGFASITLEFAAGADNRSALQDIKDEVDQTIPDLPDGADRPVVTEVDLSQFPILTVALSGAVPERELITIGRDLRDRVEAIGGVLEVELTGERADLMEIIIDPLAMQSYGLSHQDIQQAIQNNNQFVAAGSFDTGSGRIAVSLPGTIEDISDVLSIPIQANDRTVSSTSSRPNRAARCATNAPAPPTRWTVSTSTRRCRCRSFRATPTTLQATAGRSPRSPRCRP